MAFVVGLIVIAIIWYAYSHYQQTQDSNSSSYKSTTSSSSTRSSSSNSQNGYKLSKKSSHKEVKKNDIRLYSSLSSVRLDGDLFNVIDIEFSGSIRVLLPGTQIAFRVTMQDTINTQEGGGLILSEIPDMKYTDSPVFLYFSDSFPVPYTHTTWKGRVPLCRVPLQFLTFPKKGSTELNIKLEILDYSGVIGTHSLFYDFTNPALGYVDSINNKKQQEELLVKLAACVTIIDNDVDKKELAVIRDWINNSSNDDYSRKTELKTTLDQEISTSTDSDIASRRITSLSRKLNEISDVSFKHEVLKVITKVISSDGILDDSEKKIIDEIAKLLDIDTEALRKIMHKHMSSDVIVQNDSKNLLGYTPNMTISEKKKHLRQEYEKWTNRVTNSDPDTRKKAQEMLDLISVERASLRGQH